MAERLYLVDGMSHIYRAYYAIRGLTDKKGRPTNAIYGFTNMLRKLITEEKPDYLGVAIDLPGPTVRHEQFEAYKATRKPAPEDLTEQIPHVLDVCEVLRVPVLSHQGYEADDVIGTLARKAEQKGLEVVVVTIDKDMFQLVGERISILDTRDMQRLNASAVEEKFGVGPDRVVDVLSLVGDSSDNIPGAPGIGKKGAVQLILEFGSLDKLLAEKDSLSRKGYRESLQQNEEQILQSRALVRIHDDLPIDLDLDTLKLSEPDRESALRLFTELDFVTLLEDFLPDQNTTDLNKASLQTLTELRSVVSDSTIGLSLSLGNGPGSEVSLNALALSKEAGRAFTASGQLLRESTGEIGRALAEARGWIVHDWKPLLAVCQDWGWLVPPKIEDTMLMSYLVDPNQNDLSLERVALEYLQYRLSDKIGNGELFASPDEEHLAETAETTFRLRGRLSSLLAERDMTGLLEDIEIPLVEVLHAMEKIGVKVDASLLARMSREVQSQIEKLEESIYELAGEEFNINSPKQLSSILFEKLQLPVTKKTRKAGHYATGVEVLEELGEEHQIAQLILDFREVSKLKNTYLDALPRLVDARTGRIHTSYNQMVAATGRLSSSNPNLQNIPVKSQLGREIRKAFIPEKGNKILAADYSQIELRVMAHLSQDPVLIDAFQKGEDIHERTAREVFGIHAVADPATFRRHAKVVNFGIMYGLSAFGLARSLKIERKEAQQFIDDYFSRYQGVRRWIDSTLSEARETGYVKTLFGRIRPIPEIRSKNWNVRNFGERTAVNAPIQGTAADLIKIAMIRVFRKLKQQGLKSQLIMQVHDELVLEVPVSEMDAVRELVRSCMESAGELDVPLSVDVSHGDSWYEAK